MKVANCETTERKAVKDQGPTSRRRKEGTQQEGRAELGLAAWDG